MKRTILYILSLLLTASAARADEGMWMLNNLSSKTVAQMKKLGLEMNTKQLYNPKGASLKDAVVSFGGFCTGVVVSADGLVFTNHHCGFESIQAHSTPQNDLVQNGFVAMSQAEELPTEDLFVSFLIRTENVTHIVRKALMGVEKKEGKTLKKWEKTLDNMNASERMQIVDSVSNMLCDAVMNSDSTLHAEVSSSFGGEEYYMSIYRDFDDVRLVFAPPSCVGKFGGDTDNWVWPRETGDFSVFRIYATPDGRPSEYSASNVPLHPKTYAPISLKGYAEGDFCMTIGYPGETQRYLSSFGIEERMQTANAAMIQVRGVKQAIWRHWMETDPAIRLKYDSDYAISSNYWKNSIGMNECIEKLGVLNDKRAQEQRILAWAQKEPKKRAEYLLILDELKAAYTARRESARAGSFLMESFLNSGGVLEIALNILMLDKSDQNPDLPKQLRRILEKYRNIDNRVDKETLAALLKNYTEQVPDTLYQPEVYRTLRTQFGGNCRAYVDTLYAQSAITDTRWLSDTVFHSDEELMRDPALELAMDVFTTYYITEMKKYAFNDIIERDERLLSEAIRRQDEDMPAYTDANSTMRLSFGTVQGYTAIDGIKQSFYTTPSGLFAKADSGAVNPDYKMNADVLNLLRRQNFGDYKDARSGDLQLCFITNNDITGGNSGSPMFNARGELLGLAFDGNWDAMSSDMAFNPSLTRCIGVDIRYVLYLMEKWGSATRLLKELKLS